MTSGNLAHIPIQTSRKAKLYSINYCWGRGITLSVLSTANYKAILNHTCWVLNQRKLLPIILLQVFIQLWRRMSVAKMIKMLLEDQILFKNSYFYHSLCLGIVLAGLFIFLQHGHRIGSVVFAARNKNRGMWGGFVLDFFNLNDDITGSSSILWIAKVTARSSPSSQPRQGWLGEGVRTGKKRDNELR